MVKNLRISKSLPFLFLLFIFSCRTNEEVISDIQKEKIGFFENFEQKIASSKSNNVSYALPFGQSIDAFHKNYPEKKSFLEENYGILQTKVATETYNVENNGAKFMFFPILRDDTVVAVMGGLVNEKRDYLYYSIFTDENEDVIKVRNKFQEYYNRYDNVSNKGDGGDIDEVIIIVVRPIKQTDPSYFFSDGGNPYGAGGSDSYGGGGGYQSNNSQTQNPCNKTKQQINKPKVKAEIDKLKTNANTPGGGEKGFRELNNGELLPADVNSAHQIQFNSVSGSQGGYHNHTSSGIHMFSPGDINALLSFAMVQANGVGNAYFGMVASSDVHYVIRFSGTSSDLAGYNFTPDQIRDWTKFQETTNFEMLLNAQYSSNGVTLNNLGLEKLFFDTLAKMGLQNKVVLQKVDSNNTISTVNQNSNGTPIAVPCY